MSSNLQLDRNLVCVSGFGYRENALLRGSTLPSDANIATSTQHPKYLQKPDPSSGSIAPMAFSGMSRLLGGRVVTAQHSI